MDPLNSWILILLIAGAIGWATWELYRLNSESDSNE